MKFEKYIFFDTEDGKQGHVCLYEKENGNSYAVFFIEERYNAFREFDPSKKLVDGIKNLGYKLLNKESYDKDFRRL